MRNRATGKVYTDGRDGGAARGELNVGWFGLDSDEDRGRVRAERLLRLDPDRHPGGRRRRPAPGARHGPAGEGRAGPPRPRGRRTAFGDLLTLNSSGTLTFQQGTGKGTFSGKVSGSGWPTSAKCGRRSAI